MRESYVLKRRNGEICGYIMARNGQLCVRLPDDKGMAQITAVYADEGRTFEGKLDGSENTYAGSGERLLGAYVCSDGKLLMDTGEAARSAFERAERRKTSVQKPQSALKRNAREEMEQAREQREIREDKTEAAERRWPPPPCMPGAEYVNGAWTIKPKAAL